MWTCKVLRNVNRPSRHVCSCTQFLNTSTHILHVYYAQTDTFTLRCILLTGGTHSYFDSCVLVSKNKSRMSKYELSPRVVCCNTVQPQLHAVLCVCAQSCLKTVVGCVREGWFSLVAFVLRPAVRHVDHHCKVAHFSHMFFGTNQGHLDGCWIKRIAHCTLPRAPTVPPLCVSKLDENVVAVLVPQTQKQIVEADLADAAFSENLMKVLSD